MVALIIATLKASLVVLFFMHLRWDKPVYGVVAMAGFIFLGVFMGFCLMDQESRNYYLPQNVHRTEVPLSPGTAPPSLTAILPEPADATAPGRPGTLPARRLPPRMKVSILTQRPSNIFLSIFLSISSSYCILTPTGLLMIYSPSNQ